MTAIHLYMPAGRFDRSQRERLALTLTDAVLDVECGQVLPAARQGFQVYFHEFAADHMALGGRLLTQTGAEQLLVDIAVMDGAWPASDRRRVIEAVLAALCEASGVETPAAAWWVNFRVIEEGSWGSRGGVLSILDLLTSGAFTPSRAVKIRSAISARQPRERA